MDVEGSRHTLCVNNTHLWSTPNKTNYILYIFQFFKPSPNADPILNPASSWRFTTKNTKPIHIYLGVPYLYIILPKHLFNGYFPVHLVYCLRCIVRP